ncbi:hypothetical protein niasHT_023660 [Heterodera trifolii]|uniref:CCHC-type domain-containing protein n=1 Tax=Heterodera trifolii TaxID=157864 RepID=A0ABD2JUE2_9BILA
MSLNQEWMNEGDDGWGEEMEVNESDGEGHCSDGGDLKRKRRKGVEEGLKIRVYVVVQVQRTHVIIAPVGKANESWPQFALLRDDLPSAAAGDRRLQLGDMMELVEFEWREGFAKLRNLSDDGNEKFWINNGQITAQATAVTVNIINLKIPSPSVGVILEVNYGVGSHVKSITVISPLLRMRQRIYPHQFLGEFNELSAVLGAVVLLDTVKLTRPAQWRIGLGYILPRSSTFFIGDERFAHQPVVAVGIRLSPIQHQFPFRSDHGIELIKQGEEVMAAGVAACADRQEGELARFTVFVTPSAIEPKRESAILDVKCHWEWKEELVDMCKIWKQDQPIHMHLAGKIGAKPCGHGYVMSVKREELQFSYALSAQIFVLFQEAKNYNAWDDWNLIMGGKVQIKLKPLQSMNIFKDRINFFTDHQPTMMASETSPRGRILSIMLARSDQTNEPGISWDELAKRPELSRLVVGQKDAARLMLDNVPRICKMQAPPGTGKTDVATRIMLSILKENDEARALFIAPMNVAVVRAVQQMAENMEEVRWRERMLALFAGTGKAKYREEIAHIGSHLLASAVSAPQLLDTLDEEKKKVVARYVKACQDTPKMANEGKVAEILMTKEKRRLVFCTLSLAEQLGGGLFSDFDYVFLDEAGQASTVQVLSMLSKFQGLKKLLITGDEHQLGVNLQEVPEAVRGKCGLDTVLENLRVAEAVDKTVLSVNFLSHPVITECVEAAAYAPHGMQLIPGRSADQMNMLSGLTGIRLPSPGIPLILINQDSPMQPDPTSFSQSNAGQTRTVMALLEQLKSRFPGTIRVVCLYAGKAAEIGLMVAERINEDGEEGWGEIMITTSDGTQGHESELVLVVTTSAGGGVHSDAFWNHPRRVNVALSRPRHGLIVIGDLIHLWRAEGVWKRFLEKAIKSTTVVGANYANFMFHRHAHHLNGKLVGFRPNFGGSVVRGAGGPFRRARAQRGFARGMSGRGPLCWNCNGVGHVLSDCPTRRGGKGQNQASRQRGGR